MPNVVSFDFKDTKLLVAIDGDRDGIPVVKIEIDLAEIPSETWEAIKAARA